MQKKTKNKEKDWTLVIFVLAVALAAVMIFVFGPSLFGGGPEFTVIVRYQVKMDSDLPSGSDGPGNVTVTGNITNIGTKGGTPVVHITIWTGYASETYSVEAAPCPAGAHVTLHWVHYFERLDPLNIDVECDVEPVKS